MAKAQTELKHVLISEIYEPDEGLRKVDRTKEDYMGLVEAIRANGVMTPINIREIKDPETNKIIYGLVDGLQRFTASKDVGLDTIPCQIMNVADADFIEAQIMANVHKIETKPVEYSKALLKILTNNPLMTKAELAERLSKTPSWISERLGLLKLTEEIGKFVDEGKIGLSNAYALAKLESDEQGNFVDRALIMPPQQFTATVNARVKEIRDAKRKGRDATPEDFRAVPMLRGRAAMVSEMEHPEVGPTLCGQVKPNGVVGGFALGILWALTMDPNSQQVQQADDEQRRIEKAKAKEKGQLERKQKRAKEAAEKAVSLQKEAKEAETTSV